MEKKSSANVREEEKTSLACFRFYVRIQNIRTSEFRKPMLKSIEFEIAQHCDVVSSDRVTVRLLQAPFFFTLN